MAFFTKKKIQLEKTQENQSHKMRFLHRKDQLPTFYLKLNMKNEVQILIGHYLVQSRRKESTRIGTRLEFVVKGATLML